MTLLMTAHLTHAQAHSLGLDAGFIKTGAWEKVYEVCCFQALTLTTTTTTKFACIAPCAFFDTSVRPSFSPGKVSLFRPSYSIENGQHIACLSCAALQHGYAGHCEAIRHPKFH